MTVYVDDMRAPFGRLIMCHMLADSREELLAMARRIGLGHIKLEKAGTHQEHLDICLSKRALAIRNGAQLVGFRKPAEVMQAKRAKAEVGIHSGAPRTTGVPNGARPGTESGTRGEADTSTVGNS